MRPIWHRAERRVRAHIFVAALAFLIDRMLERALGDAHVNVSSTAAWTALQTIRDVVTIPKSGPCAARTYVETCQTWARNEREAPPGKRAASSRSVGGTP